MIYMTTVIIGILASLASKVSIILGLAIAFVSGLVLGLCEEEE